MGRDQAPARCRSRGRSSPPAVVAADGPECRDRRSHACRSLPRSGRLALSLPLGRGGRTAAPRVPATGRPRPPRCARDCHLRAGGFLRRGVRDLGVRPRDCPGRRPIGGPLRPWPALRPRVGRRHRGPGRRPHRLHGRHGTVGRRQRCRARGGPAARRGRPAASVARRPGTGTPHRRGGDRDGEPGGRPGGAPRALRPGPRRRARDPVRGRRLLGRSGRRRPDASPSVRARDPSGNGSRHVPPTAASASAARDR